MLQNADFSGIYLPNEIWCHIFSFIHTLQELRNIVFTCNKFWKLINQHHPLWKYVKIVKHSLFLMCSSHNAHFPPTHSVIHKLLVTELEIPERFIEDILSCHVNFSGSE